MTRRKAPTESAPHAWDQAGYVPVTVKFTAEAHRRAKAHAADYRGRMLASLINAAVEYVLDEIEAGRPPAEFVAKMAAAHAAQAEGQKTRGRARAAPTA